MSRKRSSSKRKTSNEGLNRDFSGVRNLDSTKQHSTSDYQEKFATQIKNMNDSQQLIRDNGGVGDSQLFENTTNMFKSTSANTA